MALRKTKKRAKKTRMHGTGTHGGGARKKRKKSGHRGGSGMSGSGKRSDHKKTLITKLYGGKYFGKKGITSRGTKKNKEKKINLRDLEENIEDYVKRGIAIILGTDFGINLSEYKILGEGNIKSNFVITARAASDSAQNKVKKLGGKIILPQKKEESEPAEKKE